MKERPTDAEFEELKRKRDAGLEAVVQAAADKMGWPRSGVTFHASGLHGCYCACPDGPCQHKWDGAEVKLLDDNGWSCGSTSTCSKCGTEAIAHDIRCAF